MLAEASTNIQYKLARLQTLTEWWHWIALVAVSVAIVAFVVWMYIRDSVELPRGLAITLCLLRLVAFFGILFYFFGLEKRAERKLVKNSRAILLIDTSQSMGLRDSDSSNVPAAMSRVEHVAAELASGSMLEKLREKHDVIAYRFDQGENPVEIASYPRKPPPEETAETTMSEQSRLNQIVDEARLLAYVAAGVLAVSVIAGLVYMAFGSRAVAGEPTSWALLVSMTTLIAAVVILAVASLRSSEVGPLAVLGLREVKPLEEEQDETSTEEPAEIPTVDWAAQLAPRGGETRIGDNLKYIIDKERGGPIAAVVLFTDGGNNTGIDVKV
ncbi:MAG TPA: hypothetical protein VFV87_15155, partial [Pirellulaceae bacterium]|nr:hypothetical protein [Pirellulaceae bacterium]